jgi:hypothetical protein
LIASIEIQNKAVKQHECSNIGDAGETSALNRNMTLSLIQSSENEDIKVDIALEPEYPADLNEPFKLLASIEIQNKELSAIYPKKFTMAGLENKEIKLFEEDSFKKTT